MTKDIVAHNIDHAARAHSSVGGSSAKRVLNCPASVKLCEEWPKRDETDAAAEGSCCHEAIDLIMQGKTEKDTDVIGVTFNKRVMTRELFEETVEPALEQFDKLDKELGGIDFLNEAKVVFPGIFSPVYDEDHNIVGMTKESTAFGTVDIVGTAKDRSIVLDWKFGAGVAVEAENNAQLLYYAYAAANSPATARFFDRHKPIEVYIVQPRSREGDTFTRWITSWVQLEAFALELRNAVEEAYGPDPHYALGEWCKWCNGQPGCDLYNNRVHTTRALSPDEVRERIAEYLPYADDMIAWGENIKKLAHQLLENGASIPGYKLVRKRPTRQWKDEDKTLKYLARIGLPAADRYVKKIVSPAQAEKALKAAKLPDELPAHLVDSVSSGTTLAPESDKRPAVPVAGGALKLLSERLAAR